jgi:predicted phosphodiesterase
VSFAVTPPATVHVGVASARISAAPGAGAVVRATEGRPVTDSTVSRGPLQVRVDVALHPSPQVHEQQVLDALRQARPTLLHAVATYLLRVTGGAALLAAVVAALLLGLRWRRVVGAAAATVLVVGTGVAATAGTLRPATFDAASCAHGWSRYALADLSALTAPAPSVEPPADVTAAGNPGLVPVLLVSDAHLNPEGLGFALAVQRRTGARAVLDAGDTTSYGVRGEECIVTPLIRAFGVPYVWVRGNHDGARFADEMRHVPGVRVLDGSSTSVAGITVFGVADPSFTGRGHVGTAAMHAADDRVRASLPARLAVAPVQPDVVLVHECQMAVSPVPGDGGVAGSVPLVACGHLHRYLAGSIAGTTVLHTGTVGADGLDALSTAAQRHHFGATLLFFDPSSRRLVKYVVIDGVGGRRATFTTHTLLQPETASARHPRGILLP